jgi:hypothetical protein
MTAASIIRYQRIRHRILSFRRLYVRPLTPIERAVLSINPQYLNASR